MKPKNSLIDPNSNWIVIKFVHVNDGQLHSYYSGVNTLSGSRLSAFDNNSPTIDEPWKDIKKTIKKILINCTEIHEVHADIKTLGFVDRQTQNYQTKFVLSDNPIKITL